MRPQIVVGATLLLNGSLFVVNLLAAALSGSRAVLSQAIFTLTDLVGSAFLLYGLVLANRPADYDHPFGYGRERFFWTFVSIVISFSVAGLLAIVFGFEQLTHPDHIGYLDVALAVVAGTLLASAIGVGVTLRELRRGRETVWQLIESANPGLKSIFYQDLIAILGAAAALVGLVVVDRTGHDAVDGLAAIVEGLILFLAGIVLSAESREYLIGRALAPSTVRGLWAEIQRDPRVVQVRRAESMLIGPDDALLAVRVNFRDGLTTDQMEQAIDDLAAAVKRGYPVVRHVVIEPES